MTRPEESFIGQPVRSLQSMLRVIAQQDSTIPKLVPDGIYSPETVAAVSAFQRKHNLPITGVTDQPTWEKVASEYDIASEKTAQSQTIEIILKPNAEIRRGERSPNVYLAQAMLKVLSEVYKSISVPSMTGILDAETSASISSFQTLSALPSTGNIDNTTWKHLAAQYPMAALRRIRIDDRQYRLLDK